jgi:putative transposase
MIGLALMAVYVAIFLVRDLDRPTAGGFTAAHAALLLLVGSLGPAPTKLDHFGLEELTSPAVLYQDGRIAMKKPRFTEQQIAVALRQAEQGTPAGEICRKLGVSEATFYAWKKRYAGLGVAELRRVRQLEDENRRLKQVGADLTLDKQMLQEVLQKKV